MLRSIIHATLFTRVKEYIDFFILEIYRFVTEWYQSMVTTLGLNTPNNETDKLKQKTNFIILWFDSLANRKRRITLFLQEIMANVGMFAEEESHTRNLVNNEEGNLREG